jgi:hypothetical protein
MREQTRQNFAAKKSDQQTAKQPSFTLTAGAESWAAARLAPWGKPQKDDYDFRWWMERANEDLLDVGCIYEYARESYEFRCLRALDRRDRGQFPGIMIKFEGNSAGNVHLLKSGGETWLGSFADELVANKSFGEVLRTNPTKVEQSLEALPGYNLYPKPVESPGRYVNAPGMQEVAIDWRHYTNKEIAAAIARKRPETEPEPNRRRRGAQSKTLLKALSVMRIWKRETDPRKRLELVAKVCRYKVCVEEVREYKARSYRGHAKERISNTAEAEMSRARKRALNAFQFWFPWGKPSNY